MVVKLFDLWSRCVYDGFCCLAFGMIDVQCSPVGVDMWNCKAGERWCNVIPKLACRILCQYIRSKYAHNTSILYRHPSSRLNKWRLKLLRRSRKNLKRFVVYASSLLKPNPLPTPIHVLCQCSKILVRNTSYNHFLDYSHPVRMIHVCIPGQILFVRLYYIRCVGEGVIDSGERFLE